MEEVKHNHNKNNEGTSRTSCCLNLFFFVIDLDHGLCCSLFLLSLFILGLGFYSCVCSLFFVLDLVAEVASCFTLATAQDPPPPSNQSSLNIIDPCFCSLVLDLFYV